MLKKNILAGIVAYACSMASAVAEEFHVRYVGFYDAYTQTSLPDAELNLEFRAEDDNHDGTYSLEELRFFFMEGIHVPENFPCEYYSCVDEFSYTPGSLPRYTARYLWTEEYDYSWIYKKVVSGLYFTVEEASHSTIYHQARWEWTAATRTWINDVPVPVPEPATYAMLGLGLAGVLAARCRRDDTRLAGQAIPGR